MSVGASGKADPPAPGAAADEAALAMGAAAHEIKNALGPLAVTLELAERRAASGQLVAAADLAYARAQVRRLSQLVNDLLDVTHVDLQQLPLRPRPGDLAAAVRAAAADFQRVTARALALEVPAQPVPAAFDGDRLAQVLANLLDNAAKYAPPPSSITVALATRPSWARLEVRDRGPGITPEAQQEIFERFVRARQEGDGTRGLGLGLYLCRAIIERHGGRIGVESAPAQGATFWIELPTV